jgi:metal-sulfur cluster biosynthetic enzyme
MTTTALPVSDVSSTAPAVDYTTVETVLNSIIDPCSVASGCPAGLVDMGLVRNVTIKRHASGTDLGVTLAVTHPFCMMSAVFVNEARIQLGELGGVNDVAIELDTSIMWTDADFSPEYAARRNASLRERGLIPLSDQFDLTGVTSTTTQEHSHA